MNIWTIAELGLNGLSAIGVYLSRFDRLNSWDVLTSVDGLVQAIWHMLSSTHAAIVITALFVIFTICYHLCKRIIVGILMQKQAFQAL